MSIIFFWYAYGLFLELFFVKQYNPLCVLTLFVALVRNMATNGQPWLGWLNYSNFKSNLKRQSAHNYQISSNYFPRRISDPERDQNINNTMQRTINK